jgi:hypothetical protein
MVARLRRHLTPPNPLPPAMEHRMSLIRRMPFRGIVTTNFTSIVPGAPFSLAQTFRLLLFEYIYIYLMYVLHAVDLTRQASRRTTMTARTVRFCAPRTARRTSPPTVCRRSCRRTATSTFPSRSCLRAPATGSCFTSSPSTRSSSSACWPRSLFSTSVRETRLTFGLLASLEFAFQFVDDSVFHLLYIFWNAI